MQIRARSTGQGQEFISAGNARDAHEQDTVANDGSFCYPNWKHSHSALALCMLVGMVDVFSRHVQVGQSFAPTSSAPPVI